MASGWAWLAWIVVLLILGVGGWIAWVFFSNKRQGLPPPPLKSYIPFANREASSANYPSARARNPVEWIKDQVAKLRNRRTHDGAFEESTAAEQGYSNVGTRGGTRRGRGLEDDAWDTRVGNEDPYGASGPGGYQEEQELGLAATPGYVSEPYDRQSDYMNHSTSYGGGAESRGRTLTQQHQMGGRGGENPFDDQHAAPSLRSMSPRPAEIDTAAANARHKRDNSSLDSTRSSPTSVRKSHFSEAEMR